MDIAINKIKVWVTNGAYDHLCLSYLGLTKLPPIPTNCTSLDCSNNLLRELPDLPNIVQLKCWKNELTSLPPLPKCKLLYCEGNKLSKLPELPNCEDLSCNNNLLETLPDLPNCGDLWCKNNLLTYLPELNKCKESLKCSGNYIKYLPKIHINCYLEDARWIQYIHITKKQALNYCLKETPKYYKYIKVIQRSFRRCQMKRYQPVLSNYLFAGPTSIVCLYIIS